MIAMTNNVLYVPIVFQLQSTDTILQDLYPFVDAESLSVIEKMRQATLFNRNPIDPIRTVQATVLELKEDILFSEIPRVLASHVCSHSYPGFCLAFLKTLAGRNKRNIRRPFFADSRPLVSSESFWLEGKKHYLVIGQNQYERRNGQRPFSIRLLCEPDKFNHSLYKLLVAQK